MEIFFNLRHCRSVIISEINLPTVIWILHIVDFWMKTNTLIERTGLPVANRSTIPKLCSLSYMVLGKIFILPTRCFQIGFKITSGKLVVI